MSTMRPAGPHDTAEFGFAVDDHVRAKRPDSQQSYQRARWGPSPRTQGPLLEVREGGRVRCVDEQPTSGQGSRPRFGWARTALGIAEFQYQGAHCRTSPLGSACHSLREAAVNRAASVRFGGRTADGAALSWGKVPSVVG